MFSDRTLPTSGSDFSGTHGVRETKVDETEVDETEVAEAEKAEKPAKAAVVEEADITEEPQSPRRTAVEAEGEGHQAHEGGRRAGGRGRDRHGDRERHRGGRHRCVTPCPC